MKKINFLFLSLFYSFYAHPVHNLKNIIITNLVTNLSNHKEQENICHEGFVSGSKIKTYDGYKAIEDLKEGDEVIGYDPMEGYKPKKILGISKKQISGYVKIVVNNEIIYAAPNQKFYLPKENSWIDAKNIRVSDCVLRKQSEYCLVEHVEKISGITEIYAITVEDHVFFITSNDIPVHNADVAYKCAIIILKIGRMILKHPIIEIIGSAIDITNACSNFNQMVSAKDTQVNESPKNNMIPERIYYEEKRSKLYQLRNDFITNLSCDL